ncbi:MAG: hypothetical protein VB111_10240 [Clostridiaceae bacterium]|nr:hypothetical protein [Clostridiaceae bacterium]
MMGKHSYLTRIVLCTFSILCAASVFTGFVVFQQSYRKLENARNAYAVEETQRFLKSFTDRLETLRSYALTVAYRNNYAKVQISPAFFAQTPFNYHEAGVTLEAYRLGLAGVTELGLYYTDSDAIITNDYKYTRQDFNACFAFSPDINFNDFFTCSTIGEMKLLSTFIPGNEVPRLFVGTSVTMNYQYPAIIFHTLKSDAFPNEAPAGSGYSVLNNDGTLLYMQTGVEEAFFLDPLFQDLVVSPNDSVRPWQSESGAFYTVSKVKRGDMICIGLVRLDANELTLKDFLEETKYSLLLLLFGLLLLLSLTIYIVYKPIRKLVRKTSSVKYHLSTPDMLSSGERGQGMDGEILSAIKALDDLNDTMSVQSAQLLEYKLSQAIVERNISPENATAIDNESCGEGYLPLTVAGIRLDFRQRAELTKELQSVQVKKLVFIDVLTRNQLVLVCICDKGVSEDTIRQMLKRYLDGISPVPIKVGLGTLVTSAVDIVDAYTVSCNPWKVKLT